MGWSPACASNAFLDTLKLCKFYSDRRHTSRKLIEPASNEYISALAAGMRAQLIVEVSSGASTSTVALAVAARQTGGRLVCILSEPQTLVEAKKVINDIGLKDMVEFRVGDPFELLPKYENIDFSLVDCNTKDYLGLFKLLDVNPRRSMVVANNLGRGRRALGGHGEGGEGEGDNATSHTPSWEMHGGDQDWKE